jgi:hypothetical protein
MVSIDFMGSNARFSPLQTNDLLGYTGERSKKKRLVGSNSNDAYKKYFILYRKCYRTMVL